jgi:hypothetical protein
MNRMGRTEVSERFLIKGHGFTNSEGSDDRNSRVASR